MSVHEAIGDGRIYELNLRVTEAELRDLCDALVLSIGANRRVLEHLQEMDTESAHRGAKETMAILTRLTRLENHCATLLAAHPEQEAGRRPGIGNS